MLKVFSHITIGIFLSIFLLINTGFCFNPHQVEKESDSAFVHSQMSCCASAKENQDQQDKDVCCKKLDTYTKDSSLSFKKNTSKSIDKKTIDFIYIQYYNYTLSFNRLEKKTINYSPHSKTTKEFLSLLQVIRI